MIGDYMSKLSSEGFNLKQKHIFKMLNMFDCYSTDTTDILNFLQERNMCFKSFNDYNQYNYEEIAIVEMHKEKILAYFTFKTEFHKDGAKMIFSDIVKY